MSDFLKKRRMQIARERREEEQSSVLDVAATIKKESVPDVGMLPKDLATKYHEETNSWMHPFSQIGRDDTGYYITFNDNPDAWRMRAGDLLQDVSLNRTPYWRVTANIQDVERVDLEPFGANPLVTGVGAGGARITKEDLRVLTGEYEDERVTAINTKILNGDYEDIADIKYILWGTCALRFGPNGPEGGWYNAGDYYSNRGGKQGMRSREIMQADADTIRKLGFLLADGVEDVIDEYEWNRFVDAGYHLFSDMFEIKPIDFDAIQVTIDRYVENRGLTSEYWSDFKSRWNKRDTWSKWLLFKTEEEDYNDIDSAIKLLFTSQNDVQMRSAMRCLSCMASSPDEHEVNKARNALYSFLEIGDGYWYVNEKVIIAFQDVFQDVDALLLAANLPDDDNRRYAYAALAALYHPMLLDAVYTETSSKCLTTLASLLVNEGYLPGREITYYLYERLKYFLVEGETVFERYGARDGLVAVGNLAKKQELHFDPKPYQLVRDYDNKVRSNPPQKNNDEAWLRKTISYMQTRIR